MSTPHAQDWFVFTSVWSMCCHMSRVWWISRRCDCPKQGSPHTVSAVPTRTNRDTISLLQPETSQVFPVKELKMQLVLQQQVFVWSSLLRVDSFLCWLFVAIQHTSLALCSASLNLQGEVPMRVTLLPFCSSSDDLSMVLTLDSSSVSRRQDGCLQLLASRVCRT